MSIRGRPLARLAVSAGLLLAVGWLLDARAIVARVTDLRPGWVVAALVVSVVQVVASAWRWRYTAGRLGVGLPAGRAVREYYVATFLNQVLPGGVAGDVSRAWRHAAGEARPGTAVSAVVLERLSGQAVMTAVALGSAGVVVAAGGGFDAPGPAGVAPLIATLAVLGLALPPLLRRIRRFPPLRRIAGDARRALFGEALPVQAVTSLGVVASYLAVYLIAARSIGVDTSTGTLLPLVAPVLVTMLLPVTVAGWGLREGAAAALWASVGLTAADGVAISVAYGLLVLVSSLPGAVFLALNPLRPDPAPGDRDRTAGPGPTGSDAPRGGEPRPGSRSPGG